jgi:site-specific DNA recombinase
LIDTQTFTHVQDMKAGKAGKKVTKHNHLYRGLFRCGLCDAPMTAERQKGVIYYRCHTPACATKTVREDDITRQVETAFASLQWTDDDARAIEAACTDMINHDVRSEMQRSLDLRIDQAKARQVRLTDLLLDGTISSDDHNTRKRSLILELRTLEEERDDAIQNHLKAGEVAKFLELMKTLVLLHGSAKPAEKRTMVQNCFSNRTVHGRKLCLEPQNWLVEAKNALDVPNGAPQRHTSRTIREVLRRV